ncbi:MAG: hypothetical protein ACUVYA_19625 [Planctomycetota bacterium]
MNVPVNFPTQAQKLAQDIEEYAHSSPAERVGVLFELSALSDRVVASSPVRERQVALLDENEEREHRAWREFLSKHG